MVNSVKQSVEKVKSVKNIRKEKIRQNLKEKLEFSEQIHIQEFQSLEEFKETLNKTEVYLLVTKPIKTKGKKNILLLLHTEDRLKCEQNVMDLRHMLVLTKATNVKRYKNKIGKLSPIKMYVREILGPDLYEKKNLTPLFPAYLGTGRSYYVDNLGGYKSICPVFFDKATAEDFAYQAARELLSSIEYIPKPGQNDVYKGLINAKIHTVGLGDFITYYCGKDKEALKKIDFLFVPCLENPEYLSKTKEEKAANIIRTKEINDFVKENSFRSYKNQFYNLTKKEKSQKI